MTNRAGKLSARDKGLSRLPKKRKRSIAALVKKNDQIARRKPTPTLAEAVERVLILQDLGALAPEQRVQYYRVMCRSLGLNPMTGPFKYIIFDGKLTLYATKDCTEQLRKLHGVSVLKLEREIRDDMIVTQATMRDKNGKEDVATGVVSRWAYTQAKGRYEVKDQEFCNFIMKSETKAKRRGTLSICGLGFLDESELDGLDYSEVTPDGREIVVRGGPGTAEAAQDVATRKVEEHRAKAAGDAFGGTPVDPPTKAPASWTSSTPLPKEAAPQVKREVTILFSENSEWLWISGEGWRYVVNVLRSSGSYDDKSDSWTIPGKDASDVLQALTEAGVKYVEGPVLHVAHMAQAPKATATASRPPQTNAAEKEASKPTTAAEKPPGGVKGETGPPPANIPALPEITGYAGPIENLYFNRPSGEPLKTRSGSPMVKVVVSGVMLYSFDNMKRSVNGQALEPLHEILKNRVKVGDFARLVTVKDGKGFPTITNVLQLGDMEWEETGESVLRRSGPGGARWR